MNRFWYKLGVIVYLASMSIVVAETALVQSVSTQNTQLVYDIEVMSIQSALKEGKLSSAIYFTTALKEKLIARRQQELDLFFPKEIHSFKAKPYVFQERGIGLDGESFGVMLSKRYINDDGHYIELLIVDDAAAIQEYSALIKNTNLIAGLKETRLINLQGYRAIEKWLPEQKILEQNLVINANLMINVFAKGVDSQEVLELFFQEIPIQKIELYIRN